MFCAKYNNKRKLSRVIFLQYIINLNEYSLDTNEDIIRVIEEHNKESKIQEDYEYDQDFLYKLVNLFYLNYETIEDVINTKTKSLQLDEISFAILYAGLTEFFLRLDSFHDSMIIQDYIKISDIYCVSYKLIHAVLDEISLNIRSMVIVVILLSTSNFFRIN